MKRIQRMGSWVREGKSMEFSRLKKSGVAVILPLGWSTSGLISLSKTLYAPYSTYFKKIVLVVDGLSYKYRILHHNAFYLGSQYKRKWLGEIHLLLKASIITVNTLGFKKNMASGSVNLKREEEKKKERLLTWVSGEYCNSIGILAAGAEFPSPSTIRT